MPRVVFDGKYQVLVSETIADADLNPTSAEIAGATDITAYIPKDGVQYGATNNRVATGDLSTLFDSEIMGTYGYQVTLTMFRDDTSDTAWETFTHKAQRYLIVSPFGDADTGAPVHVFPVEAGQRELANSAANERQTFMVPFAVTDEPNLDASVDGGS